MNIDGKQEEVICTLDGFNVTLKALKNLILDIPAPITRPLNSFFQKVLHAQIGERIFKVKVGSDVCEPTPKGTQMIVNG